MLSFQTICWIGFVASRVRKRSRGTFTASIDKIVTLSIAIGTATILIALMVMFGFQKEITKKITAFAGDFEITKYSGIQHAYEPPPLQASQVGCLIAELPNAIEKVAAFTQKLMLIRPLSRAIYDQQFLGEAQSSIAAYSGIFEEHRAVPKLPLAAKFRKRSTHTSVAVEGILCKGIDPRAAHITLEDYLIAGRLPDLTKETAQNELCISHHLAQKCSIQLSDTVVVHTVHPTARYRKLKVVGIYCTYLSDIDEHLAFCDMRLLQRLNNWSVETVNGYTIFLKDGMRPTKPLRDTILRLIDHDLRLMSTSRQYARFYDWLAIIEKNTTIFIVFILLVAGCTMVATVMIQLMERSYMVGVLKVLGAHNGQVNAILLYNSLRTLSLGMLYGNIVGIGLCHLQDHYRCVTLEPALYYMRYVPIYSHWQVILFPNLLIFGSLSIGLYFALKVLKQKKLVAALHEG
ncbi:ABC transporter permease [Cardinium endosymbiont of Philonthus spinipes]|uniref:ABC transporter permease n=1 Tax=Cardinium endosymbiont of Philonthus spinipes TaxID=3077941 RepID=UPI00313C5A83